MDEEDHDRWASDSGKKKKKTTNLWSDERSIDEVFDWLMDQNLDANLDPNRIGRNIHWLMRHVGLHRRWNRGFSLGSNREINMRCDFLTMKIQHDEWRESKRYRCNLGVWPESQALEYLQKYKEYILRTRRDMENMYTFLATVTKRPEESTTVAALGGVEVQGVLRLIRDFVVDHIY